MRFRRKLVTCDDKDLNITVRHGRGDWLPSLWLIVFSSFCVKVSTSWLMYSYSPNDPLSDADISFANNPHGSKPVYLMHRSQFADDELPSDVKVWDLRNYQVYNLLVSLSVCLTDTTEITRDGALASQWAHIKGEKDKKANETIGNRKKEIGKASAFSNKVGMEKRGPFGHRVDVWALINHAVNSPSPRIHRDWRQGRLLFPATIDFELRSYCFFSPTFSFVLFVRSIESYLFILRGVVCFLPPPSHRRHTLVHFLHTKRKQCSPSWLYH